TRRQIGLLFGCLVVTRRQIGLLILPRGQMDKSDYSFCLAVKWTNRITRFASRSNGQIGLLDICAGHRAVTGLSTAVQTLLPVADLGERACVADVQVGFVKPWHGL